MPQSVPRHTSQTQGTRAQCCSESFLQLATPDVYSFAVLGQPKEWPVCVSANRALDIPFAGSVEKTRLVTLVLYAEQQFCRLWGPRSVFVPAARRDIHFFLTCTDVEPASGAAPSWALGACSCPDKTDRTFKVLPAHSGTSVGHRPGFFSF